MAQKVTCPICKGPAPLKVGNKLGYHPTVGRSCPGSGKKLVEK